MMGRKRCNGYDDMNEANDDDDNNNNNNNMEKETVPEDGR